MSSSCQARDFGLCKKADLSTSEEKFDTVDAPDPAESAELEYELLLQGNVDIDRGIELMAMEKRLDSCRWWWLCLLRKLKRLNDRQVGVVLSMMEDEGLIGSGSGIYTREVRLRNSTDSGRADVNPYQMC